MLLDTLVEFLSVTHRIIGIIVTSFGLALSLLAKQIAINIHGSKDLKNEDGAYSTVLAIALIFMLAGLIIIIL